MSADSNFMDSKVEFDFKNPTIHHDRVLIVGDQKFYVVSGLLSLWSEYFHELFDGKFAESKMKEIELKELDPQQFEVFLHVVYNNNSTKITVDSLIPSIELAYRFLSPKVLEVCKDFIYKNSAELNDLKFELLKTACVYENEDMKNKLQTDLMNDLLIAKLNLDEVVDCAVEHKLDAFKVWLGIYKSHFLNFRNCHELLNYSVECDMPSLKTEICKEISEWNRKEIPEDGIIDLVTAAVQHNVEELKSKMRECIFYQLNPTAYNYIDRQPSEYNVEFYDYGSDDGWGTPLRRKRIQEPGVNFNSVVTINSFLQTHKAEIFELTKEIREFIISATLSPV